MFKFGTKALQVAGWKPAQQIDHTKRIGNRVLRIRAGGSGRLTTKPQKVYSKKKGRAK